MYDVITIGNATVDVILQSKAFKVHRDPNMVTGSAESFAFGTKINIEKLISGVGGGALNSATTFARQELKTAIITQLGDDASGDKIFDYLTDEKIHTGYVIKNKKIETAYSTILLTLSGERTILAYRGNAKTEAIKQALKHDMATSWYYITSLGGDVATLEAILEHATHLHTRIAINPGKAELESPEFKTLLRYFDVLILNREEAEYLLPADCRYGKGLLSAFCGLQKGITVITNGARGAAATDGEKVYYAEAPKVTVVDRTGAGDAFGSGFVAGLIKYGGDVKRGLVLASANAGAVCESYGSSIGILQSHTRHKEVSITEHDL